MEHHNAVPHSSAAASVVPTADTTTVPETVVPAAPSTARTWQPRNTLVRGVLREVTTLGNLQAQQAQQQQQAAMLAAGALPTAAIAATLPSGGDGSTSGGSSSGGNAAAAALHSMDSIMMAQVVLAAELSGDPHCQQQACALDAGGVDAALLGAGSSSTGSASARARVAAAAAAAQGAGGGRPQQPSAVAQQQQAGAKPSRLPTAAAGTSAAVPPAPGSARQLHPTVRAPGSQLLPTSARGGPAGAHPGGSSRPA